jgi:hypothetical protein
MNPCISTALLLKIVIVLTRTLAQRREAANVMKFSTARKRPFDRSLNRASESSPVKEVNGETHPCRNRGSAHAGRRPTTTKTIPQLQLTRAVRFGAILFATIVLNVVFTLSAATPIQIAQQAYLKASNTEGNDLFGYSVAVSGDTAVVGAPFEASNAVGVNGNQNDDSAFQAGAAYVFLRNGTNWIQQAYLKASNAGIGDLFGYSVAVWRDTVVVGAFGESSNATGVNGDQTNNSAFQSGAAYIFVRNGTNWSQQAYLKASNTMAYDSSAARWRCGAILWSSALWERPATPPGSTATKAITGRTSRARPTSSCAGGRFGANRPI